MSVVSESPRLGRRINAIDAVVVMVAFVLIPMAYGAYLLFRTPPPRLLTVTPKRLYQGAKDARVEITGQNLRPFMRVSFNTIQGKTFLIGGTKYAAVDVPNLPPGTYDVVLYDYKQEVGRLPQALTVLPMFTNLQLAVAGSFKFLPDAFARQLKVGDKFPPTGSAVAEVMNVGAHAPAMIRIRVGDGSLDIPVPQQEEVAATLRVGCYLAPNPDGSMRCLIPGPDEPAPVAPDSYVTLASAQGWLKFQIAEVHPLPDPLEVVATMRFVVAPEVVPKIKVGDLDTGNRVAPSHPARLIGLGRIRNVSEGSAGRTATLVGPLQAIDVTVRVPVEQSLAGWTYLGRPFKPGTPFTFETPSYLIQGDVTEIAPASSSASGPSSTRQQTNR